MVFNRFFYFATIRVLLILLTGFASIYFIGTEERLQSFLVFTAITIIQIILLVYYVSKTNRKLAEFILTLKEKDHSKAFSMHNLERTFKGLHLSFNEISNLLSEYKIESIINAEYVAAIAENLPIGIVAIERSGKIKYCNSCFREIFQTENPSHVNDLKNISFQRVAIELKPGEKKLIKTVVDGVQKSFSVYASIFKTVDSETKIISLQDIKSELLQNEIDAQKKLMRILNHETMNSLAPISNLTSTIQRLVKQENDFSNESKEDIIECAELIEKRSEGLVNFIAKYKNLTNLPQPTKGEIQLSGLLQSIIALFKSKFDERGIEYILRIDESDIHVFADKDMLEQVLINIINNAIEAIKKDSGIVKVSARRLGSKISISISNNGEQLSEDDREKIFMPFYTTKPKGDGIGLSLSREIIHLHQGELLVKSENEFITFEIRL